jgi:hypothetical protein
LIEGGEGRMTALGTRDVLMYVKSEDIIRWVLPPDAQDEALRAFRERGYYACPVIGNWGGHSAGSFFDAGYFGNKPVRDKKLPELEADAIDRAWVAVHAKGKRLHIVDVGKESELRRVIEEHLHHLHSFPVLVRPDGRRLEGTESFSKENLDRFLSD